jgi:predicted metal-dependent phosphotriesterase family hydrolase
MTEVMTVLGPVGAQELGVTLPHEHVFINQLREYRGNGLLNDRTLAAQELSRFAASGGRTIVDCTSIGLMRDPLALREVSREADVNIVMGSGLYREPYIDRDWVDRTSADELADLIVRDLEEGVDGSGARAGIIGEIGCDKWYLSSAEERSFRAAARAHLRTGIPITTHAARWPVGLLQLDLLESEGVSPENVIIGHCDTVPDTGYHEAIARRGAFVQFDTIRGEAEFDIDRRVQFVLNLIRAGFHESILLSHDVCLRDHLAAYGGCGYDFVVTKFAGRLRNAGLDDAAIDELLVVNPRRALSGAR